MKKINKKLNLNVNTVRDLSVDELAEVVGGERPISFGEWTCHTITLPGCARTRFIFTCEISQCVAAP